MAEVATAAGFSSVRRFNETFRDLFHRPPRALRRRKAAKEHDKQNEVVLRLRYGPPYDWDNMLAFLRTRAIAGVEVVEDGGYLRTIETDGGEHCGSAPSPTAKP